MFDEERIIDISDVIHDLCINDALYEMLREELLLYGLPVWKDDVVLRIKQVYIHIAPPAGDKCIIRAGTIGDSEWTDRAQYKYRLILSDPGSLGRVTADIVRYVRSVI